MTLMAFLRLRWIGLLRILNLDAWNLLQIFVACFYNPNTNTNKLYLCQWLMSSCKYQILCNYLSQDPWEQPVFSWMVPSGEWQVVLYSNEGVKPTWYSWSTNYCNSDSSFCWKLCIQLMLNPSIDRLVPFMAGFFVLAWRDPGFSIKGQISRLPQQPCWLYC